jgi:hypothetical protein
MKTQNRTCGGKHTKRITKRYKRSQIKRSRIYKKFKKSKKYHKTRKYHGGGAIGSAAVGLGKGTLALAAGTIDFTTNAVKATELIIKGLGETTLILSDTAKRSMVGASFTVNMGVTGIFGFIKLVSKSILLTSRVTTLFLNTALNIFREQDKELRKIKDECVIALKTSNNASLETSTSCVNRYVLFLKKIHLGYSKRMGNLKIRMKQNVNNVMKIIKTEMVRIGCKKNWFQNAYTCKDKDTDIIITTQTKLINISEEYTRLVEFVSNIDSSWSSKLNDSKTKYESILGNLNNYTENNLNDYAFTEINKYKNENSDINIQKDLTIEFIQPLQKFLEILQNHIKEQEKKALNEHIASEDKKRAEIEKEEKERQAKEEINKMDNEIQNIQPNEIIKVEEKINEAVESTPELSENQINAENQNKNANVKNQNVKNGNVKNQNVKNGNVKNQNGNKNATIQNQNVQRQT